MESCCTEQGENYKRPPCWGSSKWMSVRMAHFMQFQKENNEFSHLLRSTMLSSQTLLYSFLVITTLQRKLRQDYSSTHSRDCRNCRDTNFFLGSTLKSAALLPLHRGTLWSKHNPFPPVNDPLKWCWELWVSAGKNSKMNCTLLTFLTCHSPCMRNWVNERGTVKHQITHNQFPPK